MLLSSITVREPTPSESFLAVAEELLKGAVILDKELRPPLRPVALLCGHALECILKAYLVRDGDPVLVKRLRIMMGHKIALCWEEAARDGFDIEQPTPDWVLRLAALHQAPYVLRYGRGAKEQGLHGLSFPVLKGMPQRLQSMAETVHGHLRASRT